MTVPIDITDPRLVRAYAHPLRSEILSLLDNRTASPSEIAAELGTPLSNTSYHVRQLLTLGLVELVSRTARRGAIEHHYTARVRPTITDEGWGRLPDIVKRAVMDTWLQQTVVHVLAAAEEGAFDRADAHHTRTAGRLDPQGWKTLSRDLAEMLARVDQVLEESAARLAKDPHGESVDVTMVLMQFEAPKPETIARVRGMQNTPGHVSVGETAELELDEAPGRDIR